MQPSNHSRPRALVVLTLILATAMATLVAMGGADAHGRPASPPDRAGGRPAELLTDPLDELADRARAALGDAFAGAWPEGDRLVVGAAGPADALPASLGGAEVRSVAWSLARLEAAKAAFDEREPELRAAGVEVASWWVDVAANAVSVEVTGPEAAQVDVERRLAAALGEAPVAVRMVASRYADASRTSDPSPHSGGARITNAYGQCTSGLYWATPSGPWQILTAGHCRNAGSIWVTQAGWFGGMGWNGLDGAGTNRIDAAALTPISAGQGYFYVGGPSSNGLVHVDYYTSGWQAGQTGVRTSGSITGEASVGSGAVLSSDVSVNFYDQWGNYTDTRHHLNRAQCQAVPGDSGGPVFKVLAGGYIMALGIIVGFDLANPGSVCIYTPVRAVMDQLGGSPAG